jgi:hypothetical protein
VLVSILKQIGIVQRKKALKSVLIISIHLVVGEQIKLKTLNVDKFLNDT